MKDKEFAVYNQNTERIENVEIHSTSGFKATYGVVAAQKGAAMFVTTKHPVKDTYTLSWVLKGEKKLVSIDLRQEIPFFSKGMIIFRINTDETVTIFHGDNARERSREDQ